MNLSPRQLRMFVLLADTLSFSRTAKALHLTQPTLSKLIRDLEGSIGISLFERNTRTVHLTRDGRALLDVARRVVGGFDAGMREFEQVLRNRSNRVAIAALPTMASKLLPRLMAELQRTTPEARVTVQDLITGEALQLLRERRVDMALAGLEAVPSDLCYTKLFDEPFVLLHSPALAPGTLQWDVSKLAALPIIAMPHGTGTRELVEAAFAKAGAAFKPAFDLRDLNTIAHFAQAGCGLALLPESAAGLFKFAGLCISRLEGAPRRSMGIVTRREGEMPALAAQVMQKLRMLCAA